jgi:predicted O-methyltransferase YrrM
VRPCGRRVSPLAIVAPVILTDAVHAYIAGLRAEPDPILAEMEAQGDRDHIPIVVPETGALLELLAGVRGARRIVEVGTAIGVSTLYMARALPPDGTIVSFEVDERRYAAARAYLQRAGLLDRADLRLQDARAGLESLDGTFDMAFVDGVKTQYVDYLELLIPLLGERGIFAVDNVLMDGTVASGRGDGNWTEEQIVSVRALNERVLALDGFDATLLPVGDGVLVGVRR